MIPQTLSHTPSITLDRVLSDFTQWRQSPNKIHAIPTDLWDKVIQLVPHYPISKILITLGISSAQFKKQRQQRELLQNTASEQHQHNETLQTKPATFIKAKFMPPSHNASVSTVAVHDITLTKPNGTSLQIQQLPYAEILKLTQQFVG